MEKEKGNIIYIGKKPLNIYVLSVATAMKKGDVTIKARGQAISTAVDTALVSQDRLDLKQKNINIKTEEVDIKERNEQGEETGQTIKHNFSAIEITIGKHTTGKGQGK